MKQVLSSKITYRIIRLSLGMFFFISGIFKVADLDAFSQTIGAFAILPAVLNYPGAVFICMAEIVCGAGLVLDIKGSLGVIFSLLLMFVFVLGYAVFMGYDIDCGCFGPSDPETTAFSNLRVSLVRDIVMVALVFYLYYWRYFYRQKFSG